MVGLEMIYSQNPRLDKDLDVNGFNLFYNEVGQSVEIYSRETSVKGLYIEVMSRERIWNLNK